MTTDLWFPKMIVATVEKCGDDGLEVHVGFARVISKRLTSFSLSFVIYSLNLQLSVEETDMFFDVFPFSRQGARLVKP